MSQNCYSCLGKKTMTEKKVSVKYVGLSNVTIQGATEVRCSECGEVGISYGNLDDIHEAIATYLIYKKSMLSGEQIRFLRKYLGESTESFADKLEVRYETLNKIENDKQVHSKQMDKLVRLYALMYKPTRTYEEVKSLEISEKQPSKERVVIKHHKGEWRAQVA